jgi:cytochrome c oxidase subunit 2
VRRKQWLRGGRVAALLGFAALALTGCSTSSVEDKLRFGWPRGVTKQGKEMRVLWTWTGVTALALGVVVWGLIFWACIRYRKRKGTPDDFLPRQTKYNFAVEMVCFTFPFIVIAGLFYRTVIVEDDVNHLSKNPDVMVQVNAFKWGWQFEYLGYRGTSDQVANIDSPTAITAYTNASGKITLNPNDTDKAGKAKPDYLRTTGSQYQIPVLVIPRGQKVQFIEHSEDVLHSFWVPEFLFKRDVVPYGTTDTTQDNRFEITATTNGSYVGRCAELCGVYHSQMNFEVRVVDPSTFQTYLSALKKLGPNVSDNQPLALKTAMPGQSAYATTTYPFITDRTARKASTKSGS